MLKGKEFGEAIGSAIKMKLARKLASSKAEIARHFGMKPPSLSDWVKKGSVSKDKLPELWRYFSDVAGPAHWGMTEEEWPAGLPIKQKTSELANGVLPSSYTNAVAKSGESDTPKTPHEDDYALIPQFHVNGSCGDGYMNDHVEIRGGLAFKRDWLARMNIDPGQASVIYARGDSMAPTLNDGEVMLIDGRLIDPQSGKVYVIAVDGDLRVKRLFKRPAGWALVSDNQDKARYPDEPLASLGDIRVLGRVVWRGGGM